MRLLRAIPLVLLAASATSAQTPANAYLNLDTGSPPSVGTQLTTAIANAQMLGAGVNWYNVTGTAASFTVGAHQTGCELAGSFNVGGTTYTQATPSQSIAFSDAANYTTIRGSVGSAGPRVSIGFCLMSGIAPTATGSHDDRVILYNAAGHLVVVQQCPGTGGSGCGGYRIVIEATDPSGSGVLHSGQRDIQQNVPYWVTLKVDWSTGSCQMNVYLGNSPFTQIGTTATVSTVVENSNFNQIRVGNDEVWTSSTTSYFENLIMDISSNPAFPLGGGAGAGPTARNVKHNLGGGRKVL